MLKFDELGEYEENEIPEGVEVPLRLDELNDAIVSDDNYILAKYGASIATAELMQARRRAEFLMRMANGDVRIMRDSEGVQRVYVIVGETHDDEGFLVVRYRQWNPSELYETVPPGGAETVSVSTGAIPGPAAAIVAPVKKKRGNPNWLRGAKQK